MLMEPIQKEDAIANKYVQASELMNASVRGIMRNDLSPSKYSNNITIFESKLAEDKQNNDALLSKLREFEHNENMQFLHKLQMEFDTVQSSLNANYPPKDVKTEANMKRKLSTLKYRIKLQNDKIADEEKLNNKIDKTWNTQVEKTKDISHKQIADYYNKKQENELTRKEFIDHLLQMSPIDVIETHPSMDDMQGENKNMLSYLNESEINKNDYYDELFTTAKTSILTQHEHESLAFQLGNPVSGEMRMRTPEINASIQRVFEKILPVQKDFYVFRCYYADVSVQNIHNQHNLGRHTSTSLSYDYSYEWACSERTNDHKLSTTEKGSIMICIMIPKGTHVIPLSYYSQSDEYEILLSSEGKLHYTGETDPKHNIPIFIYFDSYQQFKEYIDIKFGKKQRRNRTISKSNKSKSTRRVRSNASSTSIV